MTNYLEILIARIAALQSKGDAYFSEGLFEAQRTNPSIGYKRPDTTVFFTAIITFTLQRISHVLSAESQKTVADMTTKATQNYSDFQNKDGLKTYNFWKTKPSQHFPNGRIFGRFNHFKIPDDVDDTAMIYLTAPHSTNDIRWLKDKLTQHANLSKLQIKNTFDDYKTLRAYSTWFGQNMYIEFDVAVLCNLMYLIFEQQLPLNQHDTDSLAYIRSAIETDRYLTHPFAVAHQYPRTVPIVYHVARLMGAFEVEALAPIKAKLIADIRQLLALPQQRLDKIVLHTSLMRLGVYDFDLEPVEDITTSDFEGFYFFIAGLLTAYQQPMLYRMARWPLFHIRWQCEAHCWTLIAEYVSLQVSNKNPNFA
jgi:hypothetical protein